jgi:DNA-binding NarL/FixJ family response regulator
MNKSIRLLSVDDHGFFVEGLQTRIDAESDMQLVGRLASADQLVEETKRLKPDIALLDVHMPGTDVFEAIGDLLRYCSDVRVVMLSAYMRDRYIDAAYRAGAWGYFSKSDEPNSVIAGLRRVASGEMVFPAEVLERIQSARHEGNQRKTISKIEMLTPRERQILRMIGKGMTRTEIADEISRSPMTVDNHRKSIMKKLGIHDRVELARFAIAEELVEV